MVRLVYFFAAVNIATFSVIYERTRELSWTLVDWPKEQQFGDIVVHIRTDN